ncbi:DUF3631 domain-containing protein [Rhodococcus pyridinivorans]
MNEHEITFVKRVAQLGTVFVARPGRGDLEFIRPKGWPDLDPAENTTRLRTYKPGDGLVFVTNERLAVIDVDTKNGADLNQVADWLNELDVLTYAYVHTPSGGAHIYIDGHPDLPNIAADSDRDGLEGLPGVEIASHRRAVFLPGTSRPKYDGAGYRIEFDELDRMGDSDPTSTERLLAWIADHRVRPAVKPFTPSVPWRGGAPTDREAKYLEAALTGQVDEIAAMGPNSGRNHALFTGALKLGNYVAGAGLDEGRVEAALTDAAQSCGLLDEDGPAAVMATIRSGIRAGKQNPKAVPDPSPRTTSSTSSTGSPGSIERGSEPETTGSTASTGSTGSFESPTEPVQPLAEILDEIRRHFTNYVQTVAPSDLDILTLWTAHTHVCEETYTSPRLVLDSPIHGSGKTTVLEHIERLALRPVQMSTISSPALLVRMLVDGPRTIEIDEVDRSLNPNKPGIEDIIAVLNSGYKRGATRPVLVPSKEDGWVSKEMPTFAPVVMAGNAPDLPEDTRSRCITVLLMPAQDGDIEETDWELIEPEVLNLGERTAASLNAVREQIRSNRPEVPKGCIGRMKERWLPLKRVAAAASPEWAAKVDQLIEQDIESEKLMRDEGLQTLPPHIQLLHDIHTTMLDEDTFIETNVLIARLIACNPQRWSAQSTFGKDLTAQRLGRMLVKHYRIHSGRQGGTGPRGYHRDSFATAFKLMRVGSVEPEKKPAQPVEPAEPVVNQ